MKTHQLSLQYLLCWHKRVQYITIPDDWGDPTPWSFWSVFGLHKSLNSRSAELETVYMTLRMTTFSPKFQRALWPKKKWMGQQAFWIHLYRNSSDNFLLHILWQLWQFSFLYRCRAYLKPFANFANILGKYSSQIFFAILPKRWGGCGAFTYTYLTIIELQ